MAPKKPSLTIYLSRFGVKPFHISTVRNSSTLDGPSQSPFGNQGAPIVVQFSTPTTSDAGNTSRSTLLRTRLIDVNMKFTSSNQGRLLPGGRWVLVRDKGKVYAIDLEEPDKPIPQLIEPGEVDDQTGLRDCFDYWSIWESPNCPSSTIRLVLYRREPSSSAPHSRFCIYEVKSQGHGSNTCLVATPITTLRYLSDTTSQWL